MLYGDSSKKDAFLNAIRPSKVVYNSLIAFIGISFESFGIIDKWRADVDNENVVTIINTSLFVVNFKKKSLKSMVFIQCYMSYINLITHISLLKNKSDYNKKKWSVIF